MKRLLIGCTSAHGPDFDARREGVVNTWGQYALADERIDFFFVLGDPKLKLPVRDGMYLKVPCEDGYWSLSEKTRHLCAYALTEGFEYLLKCDDDCYVQVPRLVNMLDGIKSPLTGMNHVGHYHGGAGYIMTPTAAMVIAMDLNRELPGNWKKLEDQDGWMCLQARGLTFQHDRRFHAWGNNPVLPNNDQITFHYQPPAGMRYTYDRFRWQFPIRDERIPKVLHFIWLGDEVPDYVEQNWNTWRNLHPDWTMYIWRDEHIDSGTWQLPIEQCRNAAHKSMLLRWELLQQFGGVYVDCDVECLRPIDGLIKGCNGFIGAEDEKAFCCAVMGAAKRDEFTAEVISHLMKKFDLHNSDLPAHCGSRFITPLVVKHGQHWRAFDPSYFYPLHWSGKETNLDRAYARHAWKATWRIV